MAVQSLTGHHVMIRYVRTACCLSYWQKSLCDTVMAPRLFSPLSTVHCLWPNPDRKLIAAGSNLKPVPQRNHTAQGGHGHRLLSGWAERGQKERAVTWSVLNIWTSRVGRFLKLNLIVASCTDEMLCILTFIRSHSDRRDASRRRFSCLENLLEDIKSSPRDKCNSAFSSSSSSSLTNVPLHVFILYVHCEHAPACSF